MTFVAVVTALFPMTYQKLNDDWDVHARVPNTTCASPETSGSSTVGQVGRAVLEVGVEDRGELLRRVLERSPYGRTFPEVPLVVDDLDAIGPVARAEELPRPVRRSVVDDHELAARHRQLGSERVVDRGLDGRALVEHGHENGEAPGHAS